MGIFNLYTMMTERTKNYLLFSIITLLSLSIWGPILYYFFWPNFIHEIDNTDWKFVFLLYSKLLIWFFYFWIIKSQVKYFTIGEGKDVYLLYSVYSLVLIAWVFCFILSGLIFLVFEDNKNRFEYSVVSFLISMPYVTFKLIKRKNINNSKN